MTKGRYVIKHLTDTAGGRILLLMGVLLAAGLSLACFTFNAEANSSDLTPIRTVHKISVDKTDYCFSVQHNVVITPEVIEQTEKDDDLIALILDGAGFYMKATSCTDSSHPAITAKQWAEKTHGTVFLKDSEVSAIRNADPSDGSPVKFYLDIRVTKEPLDDDPEIYSTFQSTCPSLLFVVVATEKDAKYEPYICEDAAVIITPDATPATKTTTAKKPAVPKKAPTPNESLPEYKTIKMTDRSGSPVEPTLRDGDPVSLEWVEASNRPDKANSGNKPSEVSKMHTGLKVAAVIIAAVLAALIVIIRKRSQEV